MSVFYRVRTIVLEGLPTRFLEYYVVLDGRSQLTAPTDFPPRFANRVTSVKSVSTDIGPIVVQRVDSEAPTALQKRSLDILKQGIWVTASDVVPKGGIPELGTPWLSTYYGVLFDSRTVQVILHAHKDLFYQFKITDQLKDPIVVYHGTSKNNVKSIQASGLTAGPGMLGHGIYFGSFWKAYRYSVMDPSFRPRDGAIFRVIAFWPSVAIRTAASVKCKCPSCLKLPPTQVHPGADHLSTWTSLGHEAVWLAPSFDRDTNKWTVKNDEYVSLNAKQVFLESVAYTRAVENRDPLDRTVQIL